MTGIDKIQSFKRHRAATLALLLWPLLLLWLGTASSASALTTLMPYGDAGYSYEVVAHGGLPGFPTNYDSGGFTSGTAPFSTSGECGYPQATNWPSNTDLLAVHNVEVPVGASGISVSVGIDNDIVAYWDGTQIGSDTHGGCASNDSFTYQVPETLTQPGTHQVAFRAIDDGSVAYFDATVQAASVTPPAPDLPLASDGGVTASARPGQLIQNDFWFFTDADERAQNSDYVVTINWGDRTPNTSGFVEAMGGSGGTSSFALGGTHKYNHEGLYKATATVVDHAPYDFGGRTISIPTNIAVFGSAIGDKTRLAAVAASGTFFAILTCGGLGAVDVATLGWFTPLAIAGCGAAVGGTAGAIDAANNDPPSEQYRRLFRPPHLNVPSLSSLRRHCQGLRPAPCRRLALLERPYLAAFAQVTSSSEALGVTANRFTAAALHHDRLWVKRQRNAAHRFLRTMRRALALRRKAGRKLARALTQYNLDVVLSGSSLDASTSDLYHGRSIPSTTLRRLIREGIVASPTDLGHLLFLATRAGGRPSVLRLTQLLGQ